jgi:hypothetical protein
MAMVENIFLTEVKKALKPKHKSKTKKDHVLSFQIMKLYFLFLKVILTHMKETKTREYYNYRRTKEYKENLRTDFDENKIKTDLCFIYLFFEKTLT